MNKFEPRRVINGTFGELWCDDDYMAETTGLEAKVTIEKSEVNQTGTLAKGYKTTGLDLKGMLKLNKVSSYFTKKISANIKKGINPTCTLISKLADPDAFGAERVKLTGVTFDEITLANWETKKTGEESIPFTFMDWELLDTIDVR